MTAKTEAITRIMKASREMAQVFAFERSTPLLAAHLTMPQLKVLLVLSYHDGSSGQELAGVMGHEIGHVTARHSVQQMSRQQVAQIGLVVGMVIDPKLMRSATV